MDLNLEPKGSGKSSRGLVLLCVLTTLPFTACWGSSPGQRTPGSHHHPVAIGIVCDETTPETRRQLHGWDGRFSDGRTGKVCVDSRKLLNFIPERVGTRYDRIVENRVLILLMKAADGKRLGELTSLKSSEMRWQVFMLDGEVVSLAPVGGVFKGTMLTVNLASDEAAMGLAMLISI